MVLSKLQLFSSYVSNNDRENLFLVLHTLFWTNVPMYMDDPFKSFVKWSEHKMLLIRWIQRKDSLLIASDLVNERLYQISHVTMWHSYENSYYWHDIHNFYLLLLVLKHMSQKLKSYPLATICLFKHLHSKWRGENRRIHLLTNMYSSSNTIEDFCG